MTLQTTPSATVGPYLSIGMTWEDGPYVVAPDTPGALWIRGAVHDGAGDVVRDAMVETWQADPDGRFDHPDDPRGRAPGGFRGFARCPTDAAGAWGIVTLKPGRVPLHDGRLQAPHINVLIFARGLLRQLVTRIYFPDEVEANAADSVLASVGDAAARSTLISRQSDGALEFDIHLQGDRQTVFFDV
jgi:protocatechuate 3,4-dioxygenase alpha subunit